jgi:peptidoglycan hydrolase CwlO-like protein
MISSSSKASEAVAIIPCTPNQQLNGNESLEENLLRREVNTLSCQLKTANERIRQLDGKNARMSDLSVQLVKTEEQLEYTTEENKELSSRVRALEEAIILQETELDNALAAMRQNDHAKRERDILEAIEAANPFASEEVCEQPSIREELKAVQGELDQLQQERDMAVDKATKVSIQLAELKAETDESRGQLAENHAHIEQMRALWPQGSSSSTGASNRGFFWSKKNEKSARS